jgi:hypothetical protein
MNTNQASVGSCKERRISAPRHVQWGRGPVYARNSENCFKPLQLPGIAPNSPSVSSLDDYERSLLNHASAAVAANFVSATTFGVPPDQSGLTSCARRWEVTSSAAVGSESATYRQRLNELRDIEAQRLAIIESRISPNSRIVCSRKY